MVISDVQIMQWLSAFIWPFIRIGAFVMSAPIIGTRALPLRIRLMFALGLTVVLAPVAAPAAVIAPMGADGFLVALNQIMIGATIGLVLRLTFFVFEFTGQLVAQQMGLGFAAMVDPTSGAQVPVLSHLYIVLATLLFFVFDAHHALIELLAQSFTFVPVGVGSLTAAGADVVLAWSSGLFVSALLLALPVLVALLVINLALGVIVRAAPQLNIFAIGFPVMILIGVVLMMLTLPNLALYAERLFAEGLESVRQALVLQ